MPSGLFVENSAVTLWIYSVCFTQFAHSVVLNLFSLCVYPNFVNKFCDVCSQDSLRVFLGFYTVFTKPKASTT